MSPGVVNKPDAGGGAAATWPIGVRIVHVRGRHGDDCHPIDCGGRATRAEGHATVRTLPASFTSKTIHRRSSAVPACSHVPGRFASSVAAAGARDSRALPQAGDVGAGIQIALGIELFTPRPTTLSTRFSLLL